MNSVTVTTTRIINSTLQIKTHKYQILLPPSPQFEPEQIIFFFFFWVKLSANLKMGKTYWQCKLV